MRKIILGAALIAAMIILVGISAQNSKTRKEAPKAETTKNVATCCSAPATETAVMKTSCSEPAPETAATKTCCSEPAPETAATATCCSELNITCSASNDKKDCCQVEKMIAEKKTEAKMKK